MNEADLSWPEDPGFTRKPPVLGDPLADLYAEAQADLAFAAARRNRYGTLPGRDPAICAQLNADITEAQGVCDDAREALQAQPKSEPLSAFGAMLVE